MGKAISNVLNENRLQPTKSFKKKVKYFQINKGEPEDVAQLFRAYLCATTPSTKIQLYVIQHINSIHRQATPQLNDNPLTTKNCINYDENLISQNN